MVSDFTNNYYTFQKIKIDIFCMMHLKLRNTITDKTIEHRTRKNSYHFKNKLRFM